MENLTHTLVGLMMARCGMEKATQRGAGMLMLAANMPDIDAVSWFGGTTTYLEYHRGPTHALLFAPLVALLPMLMVRARFSVRAWLASLAGVLSHLLIDWTMSYGTPLLLPFSLRRWRLDINNLVDIWVWAILLTAVVATLLVQMVNREIGAKKQNSARRGWAWAALIGLLVFEGLRWFSHEKAVAVMASRLYENVPATRITALPGTFNPFLWRGVIEYSAREGDFVLVTGVNVSPLNPARLYDPGFDHERARRYRVIDPIPEMSAAMRTRPFQVFGRFSQMPFWEVTPVDGGTRVSMMDLRFGDPGVLGFAGVTALVDGAGVVHMP
jgi:membrane-bound metal-dependent hydrolase YbcI (DUF457 family)